MSVRRPRAVKGPASVLRLQETNELVALAPAGAAVVMETSPLLSAVRKFITASTPLGATELNEEKLNSGLSPPPSGSPEDLPLEGAVWQKEVPTPETFLSSSGIFSAVQADT